VLLPEPEPEVEWLDASQVRDLLPNMKPTTFYEIVRTIITREPHKEQREVVRMLPNGRSYTSKQWMMVWTMDEVAAIEAEARKRGIWETPAPEPVPVPEPVAEPTPTPAPAPAPLVYTDTVVTVPAFTLPAQEPAIERDYLSEVKGIMDAYASKRVAQLQAQLAEVEAERDALREQLAKVKSVLGLA
jgi:hypothetical protein